MKRIMDPLKLMGAEFENISGTLPLKIIGKKLKNLKLKLKFHQHKLNQD